MAAPFFREKKDVINKKKGKRMWGRTDPSNMHRSVGLGTPRDASRKGQFRRTSRIPFSARKAGKGA